MSRGRYSRGTRGWKHELMNGAAAAAAAAPEQHYLPFDGVADYAYADAVFGGIGAGAYTIAIKVAGRNSVGAIAAYVASGGPGASAQGQQGYDRVTGTTTTILGGFTPDTGADNYKATAAGVPADTDPRVFALKRPAASGAKVRVVSSAGVEYTADLAATRYTPDHLAIAARLTDALVAGAFGNCKLISLVLAAAEVPDAELSAWLAASTAEGNVTAIDHYWVASDISGAEIPARVGTVAMTCVNVVAGDLVAL